MSTMAPHHVADLPDHHLDRRRRLHEARRFRVEQLEALQAEPPRGHRQASVNDALRMAAAAVLREIDTALERMDHGEYGLCVACAQPLPDDRLDVLPMEPLCAPCHYIEQNCSAAVKRRRSGPGRPGIRKGTPYSAGRTG